ncbi:hypothetical protein [Pseudomonas sp. LB3P14]
MDGNTPGTGLLAGKQHPWANKEEVEHIRAGGGIIDLDNADRPQKAQVRTLACRRGARAVDGPQVPGRLGHQNHRHHPTG